MGTMVGQGSAPDSPYRPRPAAGKDRHDHDRDRDGQRTAALTSGSGWLGSARAHHRQQRASRAHWRDGTSERPA